jgi:transcriptional regulator with XRE-family HTH domain
MRTYEDAPSAVFAANLKRERKSAGYTAAALADELGAIGADISRSAIAQIESGRRGTRGVTLDEALAISAALGVPLTAMLMPTDDETVSLAPELEVNSWRALAWLIDDEPLPGRRRVTSAVTGYIAVREAQLAAQGASVGLRHMRETATEEDAIALQRSLGWYHDTLRTLRRRLDDLEAMGHPTGGLLAERFADDLNDLDPEDQR